MDLYVVDKGHPRLALAELQALAPGGRFLASNGALSGEGTRPPFARLAYTKAAFEVLFTSTPHDLLLRLSAYNWSRAILPPYRVTNFASTIRTIEVADAIWRAQEHPQVDLSAPRTHLVLLPIGDQVAVTIHIFENGEDFEGRRAHLRPALHPSALHPKLARAMVNLSGAPSILDPFCGTGGILIEAGLMGIEARGSDLDVRQMERAKKNLRAFGLERISIALADALSVITPAAAIVTDLPYGRNTSPPDLGALYASFFAHASTLADTLVIGLPRTIPPPLEGTPWQLVFEDEYYLHRSLRKTILIWKRKH